MPSCMLKVAEISEGYSSDFYITQGFQQKTLVWGLSMNRNVKVTIGICVKDCESTIGEAIESILAQDFPHQYAEMIFVDDGSKDRTLQVILDYIPHIDIHVKVFHTDWKGLGSARNLVVSSAHGDYITWVDGDMILPVDHVRKQIEFMERNPKVAIAKARYGTCSEDNLPSALENLAFQAVDARYKGLVSSRVMGTGGAVYRVRAVRQIGGFDENIKGAGEDADIEYRMRTAGWLLYRATPALFYERRRNTWKGLWKEYFWLGYGGPRVYRKNSKEIALYKMVPIAGFLTGALYSIIAYKAWRRKIAFLLPIQCTFKRTAWLFGFIVAQLEEYTRGRNTFRRQSRL